MVAAAHETSSSAGDGAPPVQTRRGLKQRIRSTRRRLTQHTLRRARRLEHSWLGRRIPERWRRRAVSLVKQVGGDGVLQGGGRRPERGRPLAVRVALRGSSATLFGLSGVESIKLNRASLSELTHLDVAVSHDLGGGLAEAVERLGAMHVRPRSVLPPLGPGFTPRGSERGSNDDFLRVVDPVSKVATQVGVDRRLPPGRNLSTVFVDGLPDPVQQTEGWIAAVQPHAGLLDDRTAWEDHHARALTLLRAAAIGVPVVFDTSPGEDPLRRLLPAEIIDVFGATDPGILVDPLDRFRVAHRQWQVVHRHFSARARWDHLLTSQGRVGLRRPSVSVVVATRRPEMIDHWAAQIARQRSADLEVVAVLHGSAFTATDRVRVVSHLGDRVTVLTAPDRAPLGELLELATQTADGDLIVKWDDDDYYDVEHIADLVTTWEYTGADLVGKACDFVHLEGTDVTMRREQGPRETFSATIAGPTLCIARSALAELGGWRRAPKRVDSLLIDAVLADGGRVYRAAGFGFVLRRAAQAGHGHTWDVPDEQFLAQSSETRRGLDLAFAGVRT